MNMNAKKILPLVILGLPSLMLLGSAGAKFASAEPVVTGLTAIGFLPAFPLWALALLELACVILLWIPKTWRIGFFLVCGYLGGAGAIEIAGHQPPIAFVLLTVIWIGAFLKDRTLFLGAATK